MSSEIASTIFQQIGGGRAMVMIGGSAMISEDDLIVQFKAHAKDAIKMFKIHLNSMDLYDIKFMGRTGSVKSEESGVYCDDLKRILESNLGLYLSF